jgi:hypothetical protein
MSRSRRAGIPGVLSRDSRLGLLGADQLTTPGLSERGTPHSLGRAASSNPSRFCAPASSAAKIVSMLRRPKSTFFRGVEFLE